jgi:hypothetical protein
MQWLFSAWFVQSIYNENNTSSIRGLNLAVVNLRIVQVTKLPL